MKKVRNALILLVYSAILVGATIFGFSKYIEPERLDLRKGDCFHLNLRDMAYWSGWATHSLQVYDVRKNKHGAEIVVFRPIKAEGGFYKEDVNDHLQEPEASYESTGLVWAFRRDFEWMQKIHGGKWVRTMGYSRFSYADETRKGVTCNELR